MAELRNIMTDDEPVDQEPTREEMQNFLPMANQMQQPPFTDREMWIAIRAGVLGIVKAIETFADASPLGIAVRAGLLAIADAIARRWELKKHKAN